MAISDLDYCIVRLNYYILKTKLTGQSIEMLIEDNIPNELVGTNHTCLGYIRKYIQ
jgi:hypothetical protein